MVVRADDDIRLKPAALVALMLALAGGNAAITANWTKPETVRPDPFTGSQAQQLRSDLQREIDVMARRIDALRSDVNLCLQVHYKNDHAVVSDESGVPGLQAPRERDMPSNF